MKQLGRLDRYQKNFPRSLAPRTFRTSGRRRMGGLGGVESPAQVARLFLLLAFSLDILSVRSLIRLISLNRPALSRTAYSFLPELLRCVVQLDFDPPVLASAKESDFANTFLMAVFFCRVALDSGRLEKWNPHLYRTGICAISPAAPQTSCFHG